MSKIMVQRLADPHNLLKRQRLLYTDEELAHFERSMSIRKYLAKKCTASQITATNYKTRLVAFCQFIFQHHSKKEVDAFVDEVKAGKHDPYDVLSEFASFLQCSRNGAHLPRKPFPTGL